MPNIHTDNFWHLVRSKCQPSLLYHTRIHPLPTFHTSHCHVYVKREDESGFGISGYKKRKYASIIPYLLEREINLVYLTGGIYSNHLTGIAQLLTENRIPFRALLKEAHTLALRGNAFLNNLLVDPQLITWISSSDWHRVEKIAAALAAKAAVSAYVIPEGGTCAPALPGMCTLWEDLYINEAQYDMFFDHIFIDAGTGMAAATLAIINHILQRSTTVHILLVADPKEIFFKKLLQVATWIEQILGLNIELPITGFQTYYPYTAASFGSVNRKVLQTVETIAAEEGILTDPVYSAKLFMNARDIIQTKQLAGQALIIHSGGGTGLMGFTDQFENKFLTGK